MSMIIVDVVGVPISQGSLVGNPRYGGIYMPIQKVLVKKRKWRWFTKQQNLI